MTTPLEQAAGIEAAELAEDGGSITPRELVPDIMDEPRGPDGQPSASSLSNAKPEVPGAIGNGQVGRGWLHFLRGKRRRRLVGLAAGAIGAQALVLVAAPLLTRLYSPAAFGTYGVATAAIWIAGSLATLRYHVAIPLPADDRDAITLSSISVASSAIVAAIAGVTAYLAVPILIPSSADIAPQLAVCIATSTFSLGVYAVGGALATRRADVRSIALMRVTQSGGVAVAQLVFGWLGAPVGLVVGDSLGRLLGLLGATRVGRQWMPHIREGRQWIGMLSRYRTFPLASGPATVINTLTAQLPTFAVVALFGAAPGGQYLLVQRFAGVLERRLLILGVPFAVLGAVLAPSAFPVLFGPDWAKAGVIFAIFAPYYLVQFVTSPLGSVYDVLERQDLVLVRESARVAITCLALGICAITRPSLEVFSVIFMAAGVAGYGVYQLLAWRALNDADKAPPKHWSPGTTSLDGE
jgi:O-antigen/teichoic acid export membrane protein